MSRQAIRIGSAYTPPPRMTGTRRMEVGGPVEPMQRDRKYISPSIKWAMLLWAVGGFIALVLS